MNKTGKRCGWAWGSTFLALLAWLAVVAPSRAVAEEKKVVLAPMRNERASTVFRRLEAAFGCYVNNATTFDEPISLALSEEATLSQACELLREELLAKNLYVHFDPEKLRIDIVYLANLEKIKGKLRRLDDPRPEVLRDSKEVVSATVRPAKGGNVGVLKKFLDIRFAAPSWVLVEADQMANTFTVVATETLVKKFLLDLQAVERGVVEGGLGGVMVKVFPVRFLKAYIPFQLLTDLLQIEEKFMTAPVSAEGLSKKPASWSPPSGSSLSASGSSSTKAEPSHLRSSTGTVDKAPAQLYLDEVENVLIVVASPDTVTKVTRVLDQIDIEPVSRQVVAGLPQLASFPLNFADLTSVMKVVTKLFEGVSGITSVGTTLSEKKTEVKKDAAAGEAEVDVKKILASGQLGMEFPEPPSLEPIHAIIPGRITIIGDPTTNTVYVLGDAKDIQLAKEALSRIDRETGQLLIEANIAEVALTDEWAFGASYDLYNELSGAQMGGAVAKLIAIQPLQDSDKIKGTVTPLQATTVLMQNEKLLAFFRFLETKTKVNILSAPRVLARNNRQTTISFKDTLIFVKSKVTTSRDTSGSTTNVDQELIPIRTGLFLAVTPHLNDEGVISLEVGLGFSETGTAPNTSTPPPITARNTTVNAMLKDGQTVMIGGLIKNRVEKTELRTPILSMIPLVGQLFTRTIDSTVKKELVLFITPKVVTSPQGMKEMMELQRVKHPGTQWPTE